MSMATRCVACGTIFRVVQDQLKVSEGWVRCGRCNEVFNALEGLFDLEREAPPPWTPRPAEAPSPTRDTDFPKTAADLDESDRIASRFFQPAQSDVAKTPAQAVAQRDRVDFADAEFNVALLGEGGDSPPLESEMARPPRKGSKPSKSRKRSVETPGFVRHADRAARWRTPRMRLLLSGMAVLLLLALTLQLGHHFRDGAAARWPSLRPLLASWCGIAHCRIDAPRRIDDVTVESSTLTRAAAGTDTFKLTVTLHNRGAVPVTMPSIDLSLTDTAGQLVARRALNPIDFHSATSVLAPGAEAPLQLLLTAGSPRVAGYTVEVFYP